MVNLVNEQPEKKDKDTKIAKKNKNRKHTNDSAYGVMKGGHEIKDTK